MEHTQRKTTNIESINVEKRDGSIVPFNIEKIHRMVEFACENTTGVSVSDIEMEAHLSFIDGIGTSDIHRALTKAASNLISETAPNYQFVAGRLLMFDIRKHAWGGVDAPKLYDIVKRNVFNSFYSEDLLTLYDENDWNMMDAIIDHDRDMKMTHIGVKEYLTKYACRDRSLDEIIPVETPQITYMLIAALMCSDTRNLKHIKSYYNDISQGNISLPTPVMSGMRTTTKQFSSCVLIECEDSLDSIGKTNVSVQKYIAKKAGIGVGCSSIRSEGSSVAKKTVKHTGVVPYFRQLQGTVKSCSQGGVRGGAATVYALLWHPEIESVIVLKNNKGTQDNRVRKLDYNIIINNYLYQRLIDGKDISLFSPHKVRDLYYAYFEDSSKFKKLYEKYEKDPDLVSKKIPALELFSNLMIERKDTGRVYIMNIDNVNDHSSFMDPVRMSNLCVEITLITEPMGNNKTYDIYVNPSTLTDTINELAQSDIVNSFYIDAGDSITVEGE
jgi:ribonucleoside-diphosphate reductase alpha chain